MEMRSMDKPNYNFEAGKKGWIYDYTDNFITENESIMTYERLVKFRNEMPSLKTYEEKDITPEIKKTSEKLYNKLDQMIQELENEKTETNTRGMR